VYSWNPRDVTDIRTDKKMFNMRSKDSANQINLTHKNKTNK